MVLGGGAGLLAVSLVDSRGLSRLLGRFERPSLRAHRPRHTTTEAGSSLAPVPFPTGTEADVLDDQPVVVEAEIVETGPVGEVVAVAAPAIAPPNGTVGTVGTVAQPPTAVLEAVTVPSRARRIEARTVPADYTAIEGTYWEVARPTPVRRLASLLVLAALVVLLGVALAALAGVAIGAAAALVDRAIG